MGKQPPCAPHMGPKPPLAELREEPEPCPYQGWLRPGRRPLRGTQATQLDHTGDIAGHQWEMVPVGPWRQHHLEDQKEMWNWGIV